MPRLVSILLLVLSLGQQLVVVLPLPVDRCVETEEANCSPDDCATGCRLCICAFDRAPVAPPVVALESQPPIADRPLPATRVSPPLPRARDILHVPKSVLA